MTLASLRSFETKVAANKECPPRSVKKSIDKSIFFPGITLVKVSITLSFKDAFRFISFVSDSSSFSNDFGNGNTLRFIFPLGNRGNSSNFKITDGIIYGANTFVSDALRASSLNTVVLFNLT